MSETDGGDLSSKRRINFYEVDSSPEFDYEGKLREKLGEIATLASNHLAWDGIVFDVSNPKVILTAKILLEGINDLPGTSRQIKVIQQGDTIEFEASDLNYSVGTRGVSSKLTAHGFDGKLMVDDSIGFPIDTTPEGIASMLDISKGRIFLRSSLKVVGSFQKIEDVPKPDSVV